jgi:hypothetical protein
MKRLSFLVLIYTVLSSSCAVHLGDFNASTSIQDANFIVVKPVCGFSVAQYVFGFGGLNTQRLVFEAKENLYINANLQKNQAIANVVVDNKYSFFLPFYLSHTVYLSADVVEFGTNTLSQSKPSNESITKSLESEPAISNKISEIKDTTSIYTKDLEKITIGTWVRFSDLFGIKYTGTVSKIFKKSVTVQYYTGLQGYQAVVVNIKKIKKMK